MPCPIEPLGERGEVSTGVVLAAQEFGDGHEGLPSHGVGGACEQSFDLEVVALGGVFGEPAA